MILLQEILVPLEYSPEADKTFKVALKLAQDNGSTLMLFHSLDWNSDIHLGSFGDLEAEVDLSGAFCQEGREKLQQELKQKRDWLQTFRSQAESGGISCELKCQLGHPGSLIRDMARHWGADLIVMGRRGRTGMAEVFLGSVSNYVLHHAACSVLVVQNE